MVQLSGVWKAAEDFGNHSLALQSARNLGICLYRLGKIPQALRFHQNACALAHELSKPQEEAQCRANLGNCYAARGDFRQARREYRLAIEISTLAGDHVAAANWQINLAWACLDVGEAREALQLCEQAIRQLGTGDGAGNASDHARCHITMASSHAGLGDVKSALVSAAKALAIATTNHDLLRVCEAHLARGNIYAFADDQRASVDSYHKALDIAETLQDSYNEASCYLNLGLVAQTFRDLDLALSFFHKALDSPQNSG